METKQFLKGVEMFLGLSDNELDKVAALCEAQAYPAGATVIERHSAPDSFYLIKEGAVDILTAANAAGASPAAGVVVGLGKGQSFGEMGLIDSGARSASVRCKTDAVLLEVNCENFRGLCESDTDLGYKVMKNIAIDLSFKLRSRNLI